MDFRYVFIMFALRFGSELLIQQYQRTRCLTQLIWLLNHVNDAHLDFLCDIDSKSSYFSYKRYTTDKNIILGQSVIFAEITQTFETINWTIFFVPWEKMTSRRVMVQNHRHIHLFYIVEYLDMSSSSEVHSRTRKFSRKKPEKVWNLPVPRKLMRTHLNFTNFWITLE